MYICVQTNVENTLPFTIEDVIKASGVHQLKVRNVYLYGSRIYGTSTDKSDYDIIMISSHLLEHEEKKTTINGVLLNIHIITPDKFLADLKIHNIMNLECLYAPGWAKLQEKQIFSKEINIKKLIKNNLAQSFSSWRNAKFKLLDGDIYRGQKSLFHSLRMLMFAAQLAEHGKITDFSVGNELYTEIMDSDEFEWSFYKEKYLPFKVELEEKLKSYSKSEDTV